MATANTASSTPSRTETLWFHVEGIVCYACVNIIESAVKAIPGVESASVSYIGESLRVQGGAGADLGALSGTVISELERRGYRAGLSSEKEAVKTDYGDMGRMRTRIIASFFLSVLLVSDYFLDINPWLLFAAATVIQIIAGRQFYREAFYAVSTGSANMSVLVSIGTLSAYVYSTVSVIRGAGEIFYEATGTVLVLVMIGKYLERSARLSSSESVKKLMDFGAAEATLLTEAGEVRVSAESVRRGDRFLVRRGDFIPADGLVVSGKSRADESGLSGESRPVKKEPGDRIYASTINMDGKIEAIADCDYRDGVYARMLRALLNSVNGEKAKIQRLADRVCARFIPAVLMIALATLFLWYGYLAPGDFTRALKNCVAVLIVACPCAMGIATPLAVTITVGALGKSGIFVRNPAALETLAKVDAVVFDKTGTLTLGPEDRLRAGAPKTVETLGKMGIKTLLLSGDERERVEKAAAGAGIGDFRYGLLPEEKAEIIAGLRKEHSVAMVGDGANDALSLASADAGIALGRAAEISLESADVVITQNRITHVLKALYAGRVMTANIRRSLFWALIYNVAGLLLAASGVISPIIAGTAMSLSSFSVVMNARSLERKFEKLTFDKIVASQKRKQ